VTVAPDEHSEVVVFDDHSPEMERLEAEAGGGDLGNPGAGVGAPVLRDESEHVGSGLPFQLQRLQPFEAPSEIGGPYGVAEGHGHVLPRQGIDPVPLFAHLRDHASVPGVVDVAHHELQGFFCDFVAHHSPSHHTRSQLVTK